MPGIFISYRRADGGWAGRLKDHLLLRFGDRLVWQDVDDLPLGSNFPREIQSALKSSDAALVVIGPSWKTTGLKRLRDARDVLRMEIALALKGKAAVIPILVGEAAMPQSKDLPRPLAGLARLNAATLRDTDWAHSVQTLIDQLQQIVGSVGQTEPLRELRAALSRLEIRYFQSLAQNPAQALNEARQALSLLDEQMPHYPQDVHLQLMRGYFLKNEAMARRDLGDLKGFELALSKAERVFNTMQQESKMHLAGACNGIGSVELLRHRFDDALRWIDRALELAPDYGAAQHDRKIALAYRQREIQP